MPGIKEICVPWNDVFDSSLDEHLAPELGDLLSGKKNIYTDPYEFFSRTYLTDSILESLENIIDVLKARGGNNTFTIYSLFGGGKTHTLFAIYHAIKNPEILAHEDVLKGYDEIKKSRIRQIAKDIEELKGTRIVIIYGKDYRYSGRPSTPIDVINYKIYTIWGYLAHSLGRYDLMEHDDESLTVPSIHTLRNILGDKPAIILIDEIVDYAYGLKGSTIEKEKEYIKTLPQFLDRLVSAVVGTKTAVIVTLPIEAKKGSIEKTESWYDKEFVKNYWSALHRAGAKDLPALKIGTGEIVDVIKKRNFKIIDEDKAEINIKDFERIYKQNKDEVFGSYEEIIKKMKETFPYHPNLIDILRDIIEKAELQKTRDMLKITRKIIRRIWNSEDNPYAIMPWHLDVTLDLFHSDLFRSGMLADYSSVVRKDIVEGTEKFDSPGLARKIAIVVFLRTYIYDSPTPQTYFPSAFDISKMVYEQEFFMKNKLMPPNIIDTLEQIESKSYMYHLQIKDGRYWFWKIASVKEQIESEARKLIDEEREVVESRIIEMIKKLIRGEATTKKHTKKKGTNIRVLSEKYTYVIRNLIDIEIADTPQYKTIFLVTGEATQDDCKRIMFKYRDSERTYKNTIVCVYPSSSEEYERCVQHAAFMLSCEKIRKELPELYPEVGEEVLKVQESIIEKLHNTAEDDLVRQIFRTFRNIAYPTTEKDKTRPKAGKIEAPEGPSTLLEQTYFTLASPQLAKILDELNFNALRREILDILGIDIEKDSSKKVSEIKNWFKTNPAFPMVEDAEIENAIKRGVEELSIGVSNGQVWYKKIYHGSVDRDVDKGDTSFFLEDDYKILPWKEAINKQVERLIEIKRNAREYEKIEYLIKYENSIYPLEKIMNQADWEEIVRQGFIIEKVEKITPPKKDFRIELVPDKITAKQEETVNVIVKIKPVGKEETFVKVQPELGEVTPSEGILPLECTWKLKVPPVRGMRSIKIQVISEEQTKGEFLILHIESEIISTTEIREEHTGMHLFEVTEVKDSDMLKELVSLSEKKPITSGSFKISKENKEIKLSLKNVEGDIAEYLITQVKDLMEGKVDLNLTAYIPEPIEITDLTFRKLSTYNGKAEFKLKKGEENERK